MEIRPIKTKDDYQTALNEIERLFNAIPGTPEGDLLEVLTTLVESYEERHYKIPKPDPIEAIIYYMESRNLSKTDLELYIGNTSIVDEILERKRQLTLDMIRKLNTNLGIPAEILIQSY
jgi:HTH-type transcriptional regulator/antitoxin HigA